jgi:hypothetical protein
MTDTTIPEGFWQDAKGRLVPDRLVKPAAKLEDQTVRKIVGFALDLSDRIARFKAHSFDDIAAFKSLLGEQYGENKGGAKGNVTLSSFDGSLKVQIQIADQISFGPELQIAKSLIDRCITAWSDGSRDEIKTLVNDAFQVSKEGTINMDNVLRLRRLDIQDETWRQAMAAISDAIRVVGSKSYLRVSHRSNPEADWRMIPLDIAAVRDLAVPAAGGDPVSVIAETAGALRQAQGEGSGR